jgi:hypothetical protein
MIVGVGSGRVHSCSVPEVGYSRDLAAISLAVRSTDGIQSYTCLQRILRYRCVNRVSRLEARGVETAQAP